MDGIITLCQTLFEKCPYMCLSWRLTQFLRSIRAESFLWDSCFSVPDSGHPNMFKYAARSTIPVLMSMKLPEATEIQLCSETLSLSAEHICTLYSHVKLVKIAEELSSEIDKRLTANSVKGLPRGYMLGFLPKACISEIETVIALSLLIVSPWGPFRKADVDSSDDSISSSQLIDNALCNLFSVFLDICKSEMYYREPASISLPNHLQIPPFKKYIEPTLKTLPFLHSVEEYREYLQNPQGVFSRLVIAPKLRLSPEQAAELGLEAYTNLGVAFVEKDTECENIRNQLSAIKTENEVLKRLTKEALREITDDAHGRLQQFERDWHERIRRIYSNRGDSNESQMFNDLFLKIGDSDRQNREIRGRLDGEFGQGKMLFSDIRYFMEIHWDRYFKDFFKEKTTKKEVKDRLFKLKTLRNRDSHAQPTEDAQKIAAMYIIVELDRFNRMLAV